MKLPHAKLPEFSLPFLAPVISMTVTILRAENLTNPDLRDPGRDGNYIQDERKIRLAEKQLRASLRGSRGVLNYQTTWVASYIRRTGS